MKHQCVHSVVSGTNRSIIALYLFVDEGVIDVFSNMFKTDNDIGEYVT